MTPLKLGICLHYYTSPEDHEWLDSGAPIVPLTFVELVEDGLLVDRIMEREEGQSRYKRTEKLEAFCMMLEQTPLPVNPWTDPRTEKGITRA